MSKKIFITVIILLIISLGYYFFRDEQPQILNDSKVEDTTETLINKNSMNTPNNSENENNSAHNGSAQNDQEALNAQEENILLQKGNDISIKDNDSNISTSDNSTIEESTNTTEQPILNSSDYIVENSITGDTIALDTPYKDFKTTEKEKIIENNYIGEVPSGEFVYKYYMHKYQDFDLYVSNAKYNEKGRNFDDYFITQITLITNKFETSKGLKVGDSREKVLDTYGTGQETLFSEKVALKYKEAGNEMIFVFNDKEIIEIIVMNVPV